MKGAAGMVAITFITQHTALVRGPSISRMLVQLELPKQYNHVEKCWMTSRQSAHELAAHLQLHKRPYVVREMLG